ncbi:MAG TPA: hypothetical protein VMO00_01540 [Methylomirabilota bacterium]|nr:hypothetical protein [Methylomirabilota bacterium]
MAVSSSFVSKRFEDFDARREELARVHFEHQLARMGLSVEQIEHQNLEELNLSLVKVNDAISHPEGFGTLHIEISADARLILTTARQDAHMEVSILPLLLERKSLILARIGSLVGDKRVKGLNDLVATVADPDLRAKIEQELSVIVEQSKRLAEQESTLAQAQAEQIATRDETLVRLRAELFERRLRAWSGFFARESMATYVGAFLLVVLTFVQVFAMFSATTHSSEIVNNAFLLILGYFFGQSVARTPPGGKTDPR